MPAIKLKPAPKRAAANNPLPVINRMLDRRDLIAKGGTGNLPVREGNLPSHSKIKK